MKRTLSLILTIIISIVCFSQTEIRNGVVIDKGAEKIVTNIIDQIKKDTPFSFSFTYNIKEGQNKQQGKGSFLSNNAKYTITSDDLNQFSDGKTVWNYNKKANEVEVMDVEDDNTMFNFVKIINNSVKNFRPKLIRQETFNKVKCNIIDLTPMKNTQISKIRLYSSVANNRIQKIEMSTYSGNKYIYTFTNYTANKKVSDKDFVFDSKQHPKVKVVDLR